MKDYKTTKTSQEVWTAIFKEHKDKLKVFSSYSAPEGDQFGDPEQGRMDTAYGFEVADYPLMEARTTWDIDRSEPHKRINEKHQHWLCIPIKEDED